jgi:membrane associated rhomboid family serine protease
MSYLEPEPDEDAFVMERWFVPWHAYVPVGMLAAGMTAAWLFYFPHGMRDWGISGAALAAGRYETIALHMFAHGPLFHILMNMVALVSIGGLLVARLGAPPLAWLRFLAFFLLSGLAGTAFYLAIHPHGTVPMVGASGALYGLFGLLLRLPAEPGPLLSLRTPRMRRAVIELIKDNLWLFALLLLPILLSGGQGGLAWEAHLGGLLFGLFAGPRFLPAEERRAEGEAEGEMKPAAAASAGD